MQYIELKEKIFRYEMDFFCAEFCKVKDNLESSNNQVYEKVYDGQV